MDVRAFQKTPAGKLVRTMGGYDAYLPNPLPPYISFDDVQLINLIAEAQWAVGKLDGIGTLIPNPDFLIIPYTRLESVSSSKIEGTQASLSDLFFFEAAADQQAFFASTSDVKEVNNYLKALNHGLKRLEKLPLSLRFLREMHEILMQDVRGGDKRPGEFRAKQNWIGSPGSTLQQATYVPPPPELLPDVLNHWERFLHTEGQVASPLVQCAYLHYQFEAIHPFLDGNGRIGRLIIILFLCERKVLSRPLLYLSAYFERNRQAYYDRLYNVSAHGDWAGWLYFFLQGVIEQAKAAAQSANKLILQREEWRELGKKHSNKAVLAIVDYIFLQPYFNLAQAQEKTGISPNTIASAVKVLESLSILEEATGQKRNRVFYAPKLIRLFEEGAG